MGSPDPLGAEGTKMGGKLPCGEGSGPATPKLARVSKICETSSKIGLKPGRKFKTPQIEGKKPLEFGSCKPTYNMSGELSEEKSPSLPVSIEDLGISIQFRKKTSFSKFSITDTCAFGEIRKKTSFRPKSIKRPFPSGEFSLSPKNAGS